MSEHGSFVTQYIFCQECLEKMKSVLIKDEKHFKGIQIDSWSEEDRKNGIKLPIIAGKIGGLHMNEEIEDFESYIFYSDNAPCHPIKIAVISECGESVIFVINPDGESERLATAKCGYPY